MSNQDNINISLRDYNKETGSFNFGIINVNTGSIAGILQQTELIRTALIDITDGVIYTQKVGINDQYQSSASASIVQESNREKKWLVTYEDDSPFLDALNTVENPGYRKVFNFEVPTAKLALRQNNSDIVWVRGGASNVPEFNDFVTAVEAIGRSPYKGVMKIMEIRDVSRNT